MITKHSPAAAARPAHCRSERRPPPWLRLGILAWLLALPGCAGYQIGNRSLYPSDVQTIYVPMFESSSFRRNMGERLTEAVIKEIELKTPFQVVNTPNADSVLTGRITRDGKHVVVENRYGDPRATETRFQVEVQWIDRHTSAILREDTIPLGPASAMLLGTSEVVPEVGESIATSHQQAIQRLAQQIVAMMESPW
jgi:hypothetical protein